MRRSQLLARNLRHHLWRRYRRGAESGEIRHLWQPVEKLQVDVCVASFNTSAATELTVRALREQVGTAFRVVVGDGGSNDGSPEMLGAFERRGWLHLERRSVRTTHAEWLDYWVEESQADVLVFCDSDLQVLDPGAIDRLVRRLVDADCALASAEMLREERDVIEPVGLQKVRAMPRPSPWLMALSPTVAREVGRSFAFRTEVVPDIPEGRRAYDTSAYWFEGLRRSKVRWASMPGSYTKAYRHYQGLTWRGPVSKLDPNDGGGIHGELTAELELLRRRQEAGD